jgi:hypothetical protein
MATKRTTCRYCGAELKESLNLGALFPSGFVKSSDNLFKEPLVIATCTSCGLVQLHHDLDLDLLYRQYWYSSALNKSMLTSLEDVVKDIESRDLYSGKVAVDIGTNDGSLFKFYKSHFTEKVGFDPALNLRERAEKNCTRFINDYFTAEAYPVADKASVVTAIAMFYDLPDPKAFVEDVKKILDINGVFVIQLTDLFSMIRIRAIDNICHEHLEYYSLRFLHDMMLEQGLELFDASYNDVNGGSLRVFVGFPGKHEVNPEILVYLKKEEDYFNLIGDPLKFLESEVCIQFQILYRFLNRMRKEKKTGFILGASTKGNTLLQYYGLDNTDFQYAAEVNPDKFGLKTVGTDIEIISEEMAMELNPDFFLVLPWHFKEFLVEKHKKYLDSGGTLVFPLPQVQTYGKILLVETDFGHERY